MNIRVRKDEFWGEVAYVGRDKGIPKTYLPPLGDGWDNKMELTYDLLKAGGTVINIHGVIKKGNRRGGI